MKMPHKKIIDAAKKIVEGIHPFAERPDDTGTDERIAPHDLFSLFTASIIKRKIKFMR